MCRRSRIPTATRSASTWRGIDDRRSLPAPIPIRSSPATRRWSSSTCSATSSRRAASATASATTSRGCEAIVPTDGAADLAVPRAPAGRSSTPARRTSPTCPTARRARSARGNPTLHIGETGAMGRLLIAGEPGNQIVADLRPIDGEIVIDKPGKGMFWATGLHEMLQDLGHHPPRLRRRHHRGLRPDLDARGQRPRLRVPADRGRDRELLRRSSRRRRSR